MNPDVIVVGGGPAGMMAALLLARAGVRVTVLEKHGDFLRDFRGDTVHPSTMEVLAELGILDRFLARPHDRVDQAEIVWNGRSMAIADFSRLPGPAPFIAMMPQWEFLDFLKHEAGRFPGFALRMEAPVASFTEDGHRVVGVRLASGEKLHACRLVIACDGRASVARQMLPLEALGAPIDVFWFAVSKQRGGQAVRANVVPGRLVVTIDRGDYWQCAFVIAKGEAARIKAQGIAAFRAEVAAAAAGLTGLEAALPGWDRVHFLSVALDRLTAWSRPGLLAIGDAAHAMSPVGGVGINLAIQDAVAAANLLAAPLARGADVDPLLSSVRKRRLLPTRVVQAGQRRVHETLLARVLAGDALPERPPLPLRLLDRFALLRRVPGRLIGHGVRREHVHSPLAG